MIHQASGALGWMLPDAESKKMELLGAPWETIIKWYLWYELGEIRELNPQEWDTVIEQCFVSGGKGFGDVEFHTSRTIPGNPSLLRIRGPEIRLLPALVIRGRYCPLYQRGCGDILGRNPAPDLINFHIEWEKMMTADGEKV